jgi:hypothetical protein
VSNPVPDTSPDPEDVLGVEIEPARMIPVPVTVHGAIETRRMGNRRGYIRSFALIQNAEPTRILGEDPRFARALLLSRGGVSRLSSSRIGFEHGDYFELLNGALAIEIQHIGELWAWTIAADTSLHMIAEYWVD